VDVVDSGTAAGSDERARQQQRHRGRHHSCRFPFFVSYGTALSCSGAECLTQCHTGSVALWCHIVRRLMALVQIDDCIVAPAARDPVIGAFRGALEDEIAAVADGVAVDGAAVDGARC
jgi:hypothetical protein